MFLHPGGFSRQVWDEQVDRFAASHRVVRSDARGHGDSPGPVPGFSHHDDLRQLLDALGIESAVLVGSSLGSRTAADFALVHPNRVDGLVLTSPGLSGMVERDPFTLEQRRQAGAARTLVITGTLDTADIHEIADLIAREAPDARQVSIEGAGHQVNVEQPARFGELLDEFLA
ncbi:alpha/beta fold hydrolase [Amycolatopsis sp. lyj-23]|uniref:alpha/beta fold hydrolase n=1 Tax=Amycolatopsis sp. lyj-23 TaxID=2789283 RepID=UPI00397C28A5